MSGGAGVRYTINNNFGVHFGAGLMIQNEEARDAFINFKLGVTFKPK